MEHTETLIVEQLKTGNEDAYQYIYDRHYALLCHVANGYVKDQFLAETIVGDTIFHLWEIRETLEISVPIRSYLLRAVRNRCINYLNSEWKSPQRLRFHLLHARCQTTDDKMTISDSHPLGTLLERELEEEIYKAIDKLPNECRRVFDKSRFEGKSYEEISQELGISVNTVKYHIKNALASLQTNLSKYLITLLLFFSRVKTKKKSFLDYPQLKIYCLLYRTQKNGRRKETY